MVFKLIMIIAFCPLPFYCFINRFPNVDIHQYSWNKPHYSCVFIFMFYGIFLVLCLRFLLIVINENSSNFCMLNAGINVILVSYIEFEGFASLFYVPKQFKQHENHLLFKCLVKFSCKRWLWQYLLKSRSLIIPVRIHFQAQDGVTSAWGVTSAKQNLSFVFCKHSA